MSSGPTELVMPIIQITLFNLQCVPQYTGHTNIIQDMIVFKYFRILFCLCHSMRQIILYASGSSNVH